MPFSKNSFLEEVKNKMEKKAFTQCETKLVSVCTDDIVTGSDGKFDGETDILGGGDAGANTNFG